MATLQERLAALDAAMNAERTAIQKHEAEKRAIQEEIDQLQESIVEFQEELKELNEVLEARTKELETVKFSFVDSINEAAHKVRTTRILNFFERINNDEVILRH